MNARQWTLVALIVGLAALLRFYGLDDQPLWLDEGYSWWNARQSLADLWTLVPQCDPHPPLYFFLLKGWIVLFGDESTAMRSLSALLGVASTFVLILAGRLISPVTGWVAGLMFALTPFQIQFAGEARPYALLCFGAVLIAYGALRVIHLHRSPVQPIAAATWRDALPGWLALGAGGAIVLWSNNTSILLIIGAGCAFALVFAADRSTRRWLPALAIVAALIMLVWIPYVPTLIEQARAVSSDFWIPRPEGWRVINELRFVIGLSVYEAFWWAAVLAAGGLVLLWRRGTWREALIIGCLAIVPVLCNYLISMTIRPIFLSRALIGVAPAVILASAAAVALIRRPALRRAAIGMMLSAHCAALVHQAFADQGKEPWDRIAQQVGAAPTYSGTPVQAPIVLMAANQLALPLGHALKAIDSMALLKGIPVDFPAPALDARYPSGKCAPSVRGQDLSAIAKAIKGRAVVWFITRRNNVYDPDNRIVKFLGERGLAQVEVKRYMPGHIEVHKFVDKAPVSPPPRDLRRDRAADAIDGRAGP